jgi:cob(I)alamin adenosyltransferase
MSIATKTGDAGTTALMYGHRVSKCHPRVEACGAVDELNAAIGLARATVTQRFVTDHLYTTQKELVALMGELATLPDDMPRYVKDGFPVLTGEMTCRLDAIVTEIEAQNVSFKDWATPGATPASAALDVARTTCRRAERRVCALQDEGQLKNPEILIYLNRLSDALWLMARWVEARDSRRGPETALV